MKSIVEHMNEALAPVNESSVMGDIITDFGGNEELAEDICDQLDAMADKIEKIKPAQLKRIFKNLDNDVLKDYVVVVGEVAAWIRGVVSIIRDEPSEAEDNLYIISELGAGEVALDSIADNLDMNGELKTANDYDDCMNYADDVLKNWDKISRELFKKEW